MACIYAMSDIHGEIDAFLKALEAVDLAQPEARLLLLGDFVDHQFQTPEVYFLVMDLQRRYPGQVICLLGNVDEFYAQALRCQGAAQDEGARRIFQWIFALPRFHETEQQIFVHAGIDEEAGDLWRCGTEESIFTGKFPPTQGSFEKDIIAGHVGTASEYLANDPAFHQVFWDGESHYFLDGSSEISHVVPVLKFDEDTGVYSTFAWSEEAGRFLEHPVPPMRT